MWGNSVPWIGFIMTEKLTGTVGEAAEVLGASRNSAYEAVKKGEIPTIRIGKLILVPVAALERMLAQASVDA